MPSSLTVSQAQALLNRYTGAGNVFLERLNLVCERLIQSGDWRSTKDAVIFSVWPNEDLTAFITLPRQYNTVLAAVAFRQRTASDQTRRCGFPLSIRDSWYSFLGSGVGYLNNSLYQWGNGFIPETDRFTTFKDWILPVKLRFKFAATEANGGIINVRGISGGQTIYTEAGATTVEGENLTIAGATTLTTTSSFDIPPYSLVKPLTYGVVSMYTFDGVTETLVARYDPSETSPQWRRYRVPACSQWTEADPGQFLAICKREWTILTNGNDPVIPGNVGALRFGLQALLQEDAIDFPRAEGSWGKAFQLLADEVEDDQGAGATSPVLVADSFMMADGGYNGGWNGNGYNSGFYGN